jgi:MSHA pilin protein MshD
MKNRKQQSGIALVEITLAIALGTILMTAISHSLSQSLSHSADPQVKVQALLLAEAQLETILAADYSDPDDGTACPTPEATRPEYDNICDYHSPVPSAPVDSLGNPIAGLEQYLISTDIDASGAITIGGLGGINANLPVWIQATVRVQLGDLVDISLSAYESSPTLVP